LINSAVEGGKELVGEMIREVVNDLGLLVGEQGVVVSTGWEKALAWWGMGIMGDMGAMGLCPPIIPMLPIIPFACHAKPP
jgi:hypothetical protein